MALGVVGVGFALISFVIVLFSGVGVSSDFGWMLGNLGVGVLLLVSSAILNFDGLRERMASGEARRAGRYGTSSILGTVLGIAILGMLGFLATRYNERVDLSEAAVHSLSEQSLNELARLETDVEVTALVSKLEELPIRELLERYAHESDRFVVDYADPNMRPGLLEKFGISPEQLGSGLVRVSIGGEAVEISEVTEQNVTNALVKLTRQGEKVVYFLEGHGERAISDEAAELRTGYGRAAEALANENYRTQPLLLASVGEVPEDADIVIVAGATRPLLDVEYEALDRYLARGGALLALVDPRTRTDWVARLGTWGVDLGDDVVIDRALALFGRATSPRAGAYGEHPITEGMREATLFHDVRSVRSRPGVGDFNEIVFTGDDSWAETDLERMDAEGAVGLDEGDLRGPVPVAVAGTPALPGDAASEAEEPGRLVVFGDVDFAGNEYLDAYRNRDLFVNSVNWLIGDVEAISIRPNVSRHSNFELSEEQFRTLRSLSLFVFPELIAVLGVLTWWSRRNPVG
jgi:ABC-type uncharacterized transport system involved in gliding motility auxiliary subunit